jgi:hypothetical protein
MSWAHRAGSHLWHLSVSGVTEMLAICMPQRSPRDAQSWRASATNVQFSSGQRHAGRVGRLLTNSPWHVVVERREGLRTYSNGEVMPGTTGVSTWSNNGDRDWGEAQQTQTDPKERPDILDDKERE